MQDELIQKYQELADLTRPKCGQCRAPLSCCSPEYCDMAIEIALDNGVVLQPTGHPTLKMMGESGCVAPPHLRPLCTRHVCSINSLGCDPNDHEFTRKYFKLIRRIDYLEYERHS